MKNKLSPEEISKFEQFLEQKIKDLSQIRRWFDNESLMDENEALKEENKQLSVRCSMLEAKLVRPFDMSSFDPSITLHEVEKNYILNAVKASKGNVSEAANNLGITIKTLYNKLHEFGYDFKTPHLKLEK